MINCNLVIINIVYNFQVWKFFFFSLNQNKNQNRFYPSETLHGIVSTLDVADLSY